jgi:hypothetical protein
VNIKGKGTARVNTALLTSKAIMMIRQQKHNPLMLCAETPPVRATTAIVLANKTGLQNKM